MVKYYGRARQRVGSVNTNQLGLKMSGCPSKVGRSGRIDRYISRRSHCGIVFCGWVWYHGIKWKYNNWVNPYTKEINWRCIPAAPITRSLAGGVGRLNAPRFRCAKDCGRHPWWNWTNNPHSSPRALGEEDGVPAPEPALPWSIMPTVGMTPRFVDPNWPAYSAVLGAPYYPTGGDGDYDGFMNNNHKPSWPGWQNQVTVLGGLATHARQPLPPDRSRLMPTKKVESYVYYDTFDVCHRTDEPVYPPTPGTNSGGLYQKWVKGGPRTGPTRAPHNDPAGRHPPTGTGAELWTPRAGLAAVYIALPTQCLNCPKELGTPVVSSGWGAMLPSILAIGGWNDADGTLKSCEVIIGARGWNEGAPAAHSSSPASGYVEVPDMIDKRCFFGAVADEKNAFPPPPEATCTIATCPYLPYVWGPSTTPPYCDNTSNNKCAWWVGAPIVTGGVQLPPWSDWNGGGPGTYPTTRCTTTPCSGQNFAPLVWSRAWTAAFKKEKDPKHLRVLNKCEYLANYNYPKNMGNDAEWKALPDMNEPRCGHAMVMTYREVVTVTGAAGSPSAKDKIQVWLPTIYVIGGCQGSETMDSVKNAGLECWPPRRKLVYGGDTVGPQLKTVEMLQLGFPAVEPSKLKWKKLDQQMTKSRGGANNFSAVVLGDYIYVFGGCEPSLESSSPDGGWDVERWNWTVANHEWEIVNTLLPPIVPAKNWNGKENLAFPSYPCGGTVVKLGQCQPYSKPASHPYCEPATLGLCIVGSGMTLAEVMDSAAPVSTWPARSWWEWVKFCSPGTWGPAGSCAAVPGDCDNAGSGWNPTTFGCGGLTPCNSCPPNNHPMLIGGPGPRPPMPLDASGWQNGMGITPIGAFAAALCCPLPPNPSPSGDPDPCAAATVPT